MFSSAIETERLILRRPVLADAPAIYRNYASNPRVTRYISWPAHRSIADTQRFLLQLEEAVERHEQYAWTLVERDSRWLCGMIGVVLSPPRAAFGYCLAEQVWGAGYATEAATAVVAQIWQQPDIEQLEAYCHTSHVRSARVLEKSGLRYVGIDQQHGVLPALGPERQDMLHYTASRPKGLAIG